MTVFMDLECYSSPSRGIGYSHQDDALLAKSCTLIRLHKRAFPSSLGLYSVDTERTYNLYHFIIRKKKKIARIISSKWMEWFLTGVCVPPSLHWVSLIEYVSSKPLRLYVCICARRRSLCQNTHRSLCAWSLSCIVTLPGCRRRSGFPESTTFTGCR